MSGSTSDDVTTITLTDSNSGTSTATVNTGGDYNTSILLGTFIKKGNITDWSNLCTNYKNKSFDISKVNYFSTVKPTTTAYMFFGCSDTEKITLENTDFSSVARMENMFYGCTGLTEVKFNDGAKNWSNCGVMSSMFFNCSSLTTINLTGIQTKSAGVNCASMFQDCTSLTSVSLPTMLANSAVSMFKNCSSLTSLDITNLTLVNNAQAHYFFQGCTSLTSITGLSNLANTSSVDKMFRDCRSLTTLDLSSWQISPQNYMEMFAGCSSLTTLDVSGFTLANANSSPVTQMFDGCTSLQTLDISGMDFGTYGSGIVTVFAMLRGVPTSCTIYVKDQASLEWLVSKFGSD